MIQFQDDIFRLKERIQKMEEERNFSNKIFEDRIKLLETQISELQSTVHQILIDRDIKN